MATLNEEIGKLIARRLLADEAVTLPEVGSLYTKRIAARRLSATQVIPPHRIVEFSTTPMGHSLVEEILREAHCTEEQAADAYARWRTKATHEGRLEIEGVGTLCLKSLTPTEAFERRLNPQGKAPIRVKRRPMPWWIWTLLNLTAIALIFGTLAYFVNPLEVWEQWNSPKTEMKQPLPEENPAAAPESEISAPTAEPTDKESLTTPPSTESAPEKPSVEPTPEEPKIETTLDTQITPTHSGMSYVVMGIYSTEENAHRAVAQGVKRYAIPEADFHLFRYGEKWLVSLGEHAKRAEAQEAARRYRTEYGASEVWVYSKQ